MKSPHAAVLGPHAGQVERIMRRRHAVDQMLPPVIPTRLSNIDRRELSAAYPQSQKRECVWFASNLLRTNSQALFRKTRQCDTAAFPCIILINL